MRHTEIVYLAGLFDGEGCVDIYKINYPKDQRSPQYRLRIKITNTNKEVMDWLKDNKWYLMEVKKLKKHWKQCWTATLCDNQAMEVLKSISPYMKVKRDEASLAIKFQEHKNAVGQHNGKKGLTEEDLLLRESFKHQLSELKEQKI